MVVPRGKYKPLDELTPSKLRAYLVIGTVMALLFFALSFFGISQAWAAWVGCIISTVFLVTLWYQCLAALRKRKANQPR
jgi:hypothetical protein